MAHISNSPVDQTHKDQQSNKSPKTKNIPIHPKSKQSRNMDRARGRRTRITKPNKEAKIK